MHICHLHRKIFHVECWEFRPLCDNIKYLGVTVSKDLKWNTHVSNVCTKANRTLGFLRHNLSSCPQDVKETAYKGLVRPILEYASLFGTHME